MYVAYQLWLKIQSDPVYKDKTTLIVTNDHGRHNNGTSTGWKEHGHDDTSNNCMGCTHVMLLAMGPDVKTGEELMTGMELPDLAPTVAALLDFEMPDTTGSVMVPRPKAQHQDPSKAAWYRASARKTNPAIKSRMNANGLTPPTLGPGSASVSQSGMTKRRMVPGR